MPTRVRRSGRAAIRSRSTLGGRVTGRRVRPAPPHRRRSSTAIQIESAPVAGVALALQSIATYVSNSGTAQATSSATAPKCSIAATTVKPCQISWYPNTVGHGSGRRSTSTGKPTRVRHAAGDDQPELQRREVRRQRRRRDDRRPAHQRVQRVADPLEALEGDELHHDAGDAHRAHDGEQRDAPRPGQRDQADRHVRAGDQQVDHRVVDALHDEAGAVRLGEPVVGRRGAEHEQQRRGVDRCGGAGRGPIGEHDQQHTGGDREQERPEVHQASPHRAFGGQHVDSHVWHRTAST